MSSHYSLKVISNKEMNITEILHALSVNAGQYKERKLNVTSLDVRDLNAVFAITNLNSPEYINVNGTIFPNIDRVPRQMNVMTNMHDNSFMLDDDELFYKEGLFSGHVLTSTRLEDGLDVIDYFKNVSNTLNEILVVHDVVILYRDESKDANNYVLISGEIKNIIKEV